MHDAQIQLEHALRKLGDAISYLEAAGAEAAFPPGVYPDNEERNEEIVQALVSAEETAEQIARDLEEFRAPENEREAWEKTA